MAKEGSVAPKERINIKYVPATGDQVAEIELPLRLMVMGDFKGHREDTRLEERQSVRIDKNTFGSVMEETNLSLDITVDDKLSENADPDASLAVSLKFASLKDFTPDNLANNVPELNKLLQLREALVALKGPLGSAPKFRNQLQQLLADEESRKALAGEVSEVLDKSEDDEETDETTES